MANRFLLAPLLLVALTLASCGAGQGLANAFNVETNPYKGEIDPAKMQSSALDGKWTIGVWDVLIDDPSGALGFTAAEFEQEVDGQSFWFDAGALQRGSLPFSVNVAESHLLRLAQNEYKLEASGTVALDTPQGVVNFWAEVAISGHVNSQMTQWSGTGELRYRQLHGDITGGVELKFVLARQ
jgi:hypothetical protein